MWAIVKVFDTWSLPHLLMKIFQRSETHHYHFQFSQKSVEEGKQNDICTREFCTHQEWAIPDGQHLTKLRQLENLNTPTHIPSEDPAYPWNEVGIYESEPQRIVAVFVISLHEIRVPEFV